MLIQQTLIQYLLQKKNLCEIFKVLTIWGNINLFIRPQHHLTVGNNFIVSDRISYITSYLWIVPYSFISSISARLTPRLFNKAFK